MRWHRKKIERYNSINREYKQLQDELFKRINELFSPEFEKIKSLLPQGYEINQFEVGDTGIIIPNPVRREKIVDIDELEMLRKLLRPEFERIERQYGFRVDLDFVDYIG
mgnify:CR=1 FL=1